ncbi:hypothetical protein GBA52_020251 [Prunus armeniaca]|nr:hypothetical protein GBA52_020251 [Prunus armeniaca]
MNVSNKPYMPPDSSSSSNSKAQETNSSKNIALRSNSHKPLFCTYYEDATHLVDMCFYLHGFQPDTNFMAKMSSHPIAQKDHLRQITHNPPHNLPKVSSSPLRSMLNSSFCFMMIILLDQEREHHHCTIHIQRYYMSPQPHIRGSLASTFRSPLQGTIQMFV